MATTARTKKDVDSMDTRERLWDSLQNSYGYKRENINDSYNQAYSQADRQALSRGMQRSSYNNQTLANINQQRNKALMDNDDQLIADYENRLQTIEEAEAARAFQTSEREAQQAWQSGENELARAFQTAEREAQQGWQSSENALARQFQTSEREAQQKYNTGEREAQQKYNTSEREAQQNWQGTQNELARQFQTSEREAQQLYNTSERQAQQAWQAQQNELSRLFQTSEREATQKYNTGERVAQQNYNTSERLAQQIYNTSEREAQQAYNTGERQAQQQWQSGENALNREATASESALARAFQAEQNALSMAENQRQFNEQMAYNQAQADIAAAQWEQQFGFNEKSASQQLAMQYAIALLNQDKDVPDSLLRQAGITLSQAKEMAKSSSGNYSGDQTPNWQKLGFKSAADYANAKGKTAAEYYKTTQVTDDGFISGLGDDTGFKANGASPMPNDLKQAVRTSLINNVGKNVAASNTKASTPTTATTKYGPVVSEDALKKALQNSQNGKKSNK